MTPLQKTKTKHLAQSRKQLLKAEARQIKTGHKAIGFITEGSQLRGHPTKRMRDPPLPELLNHPEHFLDNKFGQTKSLSLRSTWVILARQLNGLFWRDIFYLILDVK